ncbi:universal stress protein [Kribbella amoyensis]|uniref:universal stress protein n=1 Tax=Kribbella amoyensis TaxID=996641 RepID=UPI00192D22D2|nr:universal stress protein [Kribbella amoyensis]
MRKQVVVGVDSTPESQVALHQRELDAAVQFVRDRLGYDQSSPCPVVVVRGDRRSGPVVVGTDGSSDSDGALTMAFEEAARTGQQLTAVYCWHPQEHHGAPIADVHRLLAQWLAESLEPYQAKDPAVAGLLLGSVSQNLLHHAASPVAIVRT